MPDSASAASTHCPQCGDALPTGEACAACALELALMGVEGYEIRHGDLTLILPEARQGFDAVQRWALPRKMADYELRKVAGRGGMGVVFDAHDPRLDRRVAIKVLPRQLASSAQLQELFQQEMRSIARLHHSHIVTVHHAGEESGVPFFAMEYLEGGDCGAWVRERGPLNPLEALHIVIPVAEALAAAHAVGIVHRDVKPANLLRTATGVVKLADFGISHLREIADENREGDEGKASLHEKMSSGFCGTLDYMAPEQAEASGEEDFRADIYSLGSTLFYLLTGRSPLPFTSREEKMEALRGNLAIPQLPDLAPALPAELSAVWLQMTARLPEQRFQSMHEALAALRRCEDCLSGRRGRRRRKRLLIGAGVLAFAGLGWAASIWLPRITIMLEPSRLALDISKAETRERFSELTGETVGYTFALRDPVEVRALAWFDHGSDGLSTPVRVGIWTESDQRLLIEGEVGSGAQPSPSAQMNGRWLVQPLAKPVRLDPGNYLIGGVVHDQSKDPALMFATVEAKLPGFEMGISRRAELGIAGFHAPLRPTGRRLRDRWFGPNFVAVRLPHLTSTRK